MKISTIALVSSALTAALVLTGCTATGMGTMDHNATSAPSSASAAFNYADETFAMDMIAHHQQAIEMADMLLDKQGVDDRVTALAQDIKDAQEPEIEAMKSWLEDWGIKTDDSGMQGMDHSGTMMSDDDMAALDSATGAEASSLFLKQMTVHHQGAIAMSQQELDNGKNPDALTLARKIIDAQRAEIATMKTILDTL